MNKPFYLTYTVEGIEEGYELKVGTSKTLKVKIEFKEN